MTTERKLILNIRPGRTGSCSLPKKVIFTEQDVLKEVGSYCMHTACSEMHQTIYSLLSSADFAYEMTPGVWSSVRVSCVSGINELMKYIISRPLGIDESTTDIQYPGVDVHLKELEKQGRIVVLDGTCGRRVFPNLLYRQPKAQAAICDLWKTACRDSIMH